MTLCSGYSSGADRGPAVTSEPITEQYSYSRAPMSSLRIGPFARKLRALPPPLASANWPVPPMTVHVPVRMKLPGVGTAQSVPSTVKISVPSSNVAVVV
jgi:hypothetical protein